MKELLEKISKKITPDAAEIARDKKIIEEITREVKKFKGVVPALVGSLAKGTDLAGDKDIDMFIKFHKSVTRKELEDRGLSIGKKIFTKLKAKPEIDYAEHPYTIGTYKGYKIELVPCYDVTKPQSSVDRTPLHTAYIKSAVAKNEILKREIRLLKQFLKGIGVYGAEAKIEGFSGYLTELLVLYHGSFEKTLHAVSSWSNPPEILDVEHHWKSASDVQYFFTDANLIVVDPVDRDRNVAAAVSPQRLSEFIFYSRKFLEEPSACFFFPKKKIPPKKSALIKKIDSRGTKALILSFSHKKTNPNILYSQLKKTKKAVIKSVEDKGFFVMNASIWSDEKKESAIALEFSVSKLSKTERHKGPPIISPEPYQKKFLEKYKNKAAIEGGRFFTDRKREFFDVETFLKKNIIEKRGGFGKDLRDKKKTKVEVLSVQNFIRKTKDKEALIFLDSFFM